VTKPDALNTGARAASTATYGAPGSPYTLEITTPGVYAPVTVWGKILVLANDVTLLQPRVYMTGTPSTAQHGILFDDPNTHGCVVDRPTVTVPDPAHRLNENFSSGIRGRGFDVIRPDISYTVDGIHAVGKTGATETRVVRVHGAFLHDFTERDSVSQGRTHNDGIQCFGSVELEVIGSTIHGGTTSCIILNYATSAGYGPVKIEDNWLHGDPDRGATINISTSGEPIPYLSVLRNRIDRDGHDSGQISVQTPHRVPAFFGATSGTTNGTLADWVYGLNSNTYMDDGSVARIQAG